MEINLPIPIEHFSEFKYFFGVDKLLRSLSDQKVYLKKWGHLRKDMGNKNSLVALQFSSSVSGLGF